MMASMIQEHERAVLTVDLPEHKLQAGDVGVVVHVYADRQAYEVEFFTLDGQTFDVVTVEVAHLRPTTEMEVMHARTIH